MNIRLYIPHLRYPPTDGTSHVAWGQARQLANEGHSVEIAYWLGEDLPASIAGIATRRLKVREPGPAWVRYLLSLVSADVSSPELYYYPDPIEDLGRLPQVDIGFYHYAFAARWLKLASSDLKRVCVFHNLESDLYSARARSAGALKKRLFEMTARRLRESEWECAEYADECWFIARPDLEDYRRDHPSANAKLLYLPPKLDASLFSPRPLAVPNDAIRLGFVGALDFISNQESVDWILNHLCPLLGPKIDARDLRVRIEIIGKGAPKRILKNAAQYPFVSMLGYVENMETYWREWDAMLCPHVSGSGTRIKVSEALTRGVPVLCNSAAQERMDQRPEFMEHRRLFVSDDPKEWLNWISERSEHGT